MAQTRTIQIVRPCDPHQDAELTHQDVTELLDAVDSAEGLDEIELVRGGWRLRVQRPSTETRPPSGRPTMVAGAPRGEAVQPETAVAIRAPMLGTLHLIPSAGRPAFVEVGQEVKADDVVCLIKVLTLFTTVKAGLDGVVTSIIAENGSLVEYGQELMAIAPLSKG